MDWGKTTKAKEDKEKRSTNKVIVFVDGKEKGTVGGGGTARGVPATGGQRGGGCYKGSKAT